MILIYIYLLSLTCNSPNSSLDTFLIPQITSLQRSNGIGVRNGLKILIQLINERNTGGNVESSNLIFGNAIQMLDKRTEGVSMRRNEELLAISDGRSHGIFPVRHEAVFGEFERLGKGQILLVDAGVGGIIAGVVLTVLVERGGGDVVAPPPDQHLVLAVLVHSLLLVETLQSAVVPFVEAPEVDDGDVHQVHLLQHRPQRLDRSPQHRSVRHVEREAGLRQQLAALRRLRQSLLAQGNVHPAREPVLLVPCRLSVSN
mmetsp:Transcript_55/g.90  ORF Transcript_55/g.90 Transcript_55/m.90 type:complete len:258 (+) Transcript_55:200-973(+)